MTTFTDRYAYPEDAADYGAMDEGEPDDGAQFMVADDDEPEAPRYAVTVRGHTDPGKGGHFSSEIARNVATLDEALKLAEYFVIDRLTAGDPWEPVMTIRDSDDYTAGVLVVSMVRRRRDDGVYVYNAVRVVLETAVRS